MSDKSGTPPDPNRTLTELDLVSAQLPDWRMLIDRLHASFDTGDFVTAVKLVDAITLAAEELDHHPDLNLAYGRLDVRLISHDVGGVTSRDVVLAHTISELALAAGATSHPERTSVLELGLDSADGPEIRPFWAALLDYETVEAWGEIQIRDATGRRATIWFQPTEAHEVPQQRWHLDLRIPPEAVEARIAAAIEAGGELVDDTSAPAFWVLADPQGNRVPDHVAGPRVAGRVRHPSPPGTSRGGSVLGSPGWRPTPRCAAEHAPRRRNRSYGVPELTAPVRVDVWPPIAGFPAPNGS